LRRGGTAPEDLLDLLVFVGLEAEIGEGLCDVGVRGCELHCLLDLLRSVLRGIDLRGIRRAEVGRHVLFGALSYVTALRAILAVSALGGRSAFTMGRLAHPPRRGRCAARLGRHLAGGGGERRPMTARLEWESWQLPRSSCSTSSLRWPTPR